VSKLDGANLARGGHMPDGRGHFKGRFALTPDRCVGLFRTAAPPRSAHS